MMRYIVGNRNPYLLSVVLLLCLFGALPGELLQSEPWQSAVPRRCMSPTSRVPQHRRSGPRATEEAGLGTVRDRSQLPRTR